MLSFNLYNIAEVKVTERLLNALINGNMMKKLTRLFLAGMLLLNITTPYYSAQAESEDINNGVDEIIANMTLEEKVVQTLMPDFRNWEVDGEEVGVTELNDDIRQIFADYQIGGVILFAENMVETEQKVRLVYQMQASQVESDHLPLLIGIDQEGGIVNRLGSGTQLPGNMALGATNGPEYSKLAGDIIGSELEALGINVNFAPSVDINNNPKNPVIGLRSFSSDPEIV